MKVITLCLMIKLFIRQTFGSAMGCPLSATVAILVMDDLLKKLYDKMNFERNGNNDRPLFFKKYMDDFFTILHEDIVTDVLDMLNSYHPRIQFTVEHEENGMINFLDTTIIKEENGEITTKWYQKSIASGRILNYYSHHSYNLKRNTAMG